VSTNNATGYYMTMSTLDNSTHLVNNNNTPSDSSDDYYIETLPSTGDSSGIDCSNTANGCTESNFLVNRWGYKLGTSNYLSFTSGVTIADKNTPVVDDNINLTFASKVDYDTVAGLYSTILNFTATTKPVPVYMQYMTPAACTTTPRLVTDIRDNQEYYVARLADGKCWMLDNLNLDLTDESIVANLTTENTNIDTTNDPYALESLKNGARSNGDKYATAGLEYHNWTGAGMTPLSPNYSYSQPLVNRSGKCDSTKNSSYPCVGKWQDASYTNNTVIDTADSSNTKYNYGPGSYKIGTFYNYCAASAGTYCYGNASAGITASGDATSDICPAGWHMPSDNGGNNGDYLTLCSAIKGSACTGTDWNTMSITDSTSLQYQLSTPLSGYYYSGTALRQGTYGSFWSTTYYSDIGMRRLIVNSSGVYPQGNYVRYDGNSIRCVSP
ncbi:hypothetical protein IKF23_00915, partial [Candidatus Saccharibacteria bacterium]|nr:hypothetical protein [Candidatus Saccharibacteria bacterium]